MASEFLSTVDLSPEEKQKLSSLAAPSAEALLAMRRASPQAFEALLGKERADQITSALEQQLSPEQKNKLNSTSNVRHFPLGASLGTPPSELSKPKFDIAERDQVFAQLQELRKVNSPSPEQKKKIANLEDELNSILDSQ